MVEDTFERICCSFNHEKVKLVDLIPVQERMFGEWNMALLSAEEDTSISVINELENIHFMTGANARAAVDQMKQCLDVVARA